MTNFHQTDQKYTLHHTLLPLLKTVSRSFYLSIRILPQKAMPAICIAYLIARTADSIADSPSRNRDLKKRLLLSLQSLMQPNATTVLKNPLIREDIIRLELDSTEQNLLQSLSIVLDCYTQLSRAEQEPVANVVTTLISGMLEDMALYKENQSLASLETMQDLDKYTYLVAGCVGEFWTRILQMHYGSVLHWNLEEQIENGIKFGKALQLTNILRDISKDAKLGRCYLPEQLMTNAHLSPSVILTADNSLILQPVLTKLLNTALTYYDHAERYLLNTPRRQIKMRLAAIWPIAIGLKTLALIKHNQDLNKPVKIKRQQVYRLMLISPLFIFSNTLSHTYLEYLKRDL